MGCLRNMYLQVIKVMLIAHTTNNIKKYIALSIFSGNKGKTFLINKVKYFNQILVVGPKLLFTFRVL